MDKQIFVLIMLVVFVLVFVFLKDAARRMRRSNNNNNKRQDNNEVENFLSEKVARTFLSRRDYYRNIYLKSDAWKRKRYVVLKRDNWRCVYCGRPATQVHHKRYAKKNIGKEPIEWLVSVCKSCHDREHFW